MKKTAMNFAKLTFAFSSKSQLQEIKRFLREEKENLIKSKISSCPMVHVVEKKKKNGQQVSHL